jgi:hypothetical protein
MLKCRTNRLPKTQKMPVSRATERGLTWSSPTGDLVPEKWAVKTGCRPLAKVPFIDPDPLNFDIGLIKYRHSLWWCRPEYSGGRRLEPLAPFTERLSRELRYIRDRRDDRDSGETVSPQPLDRISNDNFP